MLVIIAYFDDDMDAESSEYTKIDVLAVGGLIQYTIPRLSFPVFNVMLRPFAYRYHLLDRSSGVEWD